MKNVEQRSVPDTTGQNPGCDSELDVSGLLIWRRIRVLCSEQSLLWDSCRTESRSNLETAALPAIYGNTDLCAVYVACQRGGYEELEQEISRREDRKRESVREKIWKSPPVWGGLDPWPILWQKHLKRSRSPMWGAEAVELSDSVSPCKLRQPAY